MFAISAMMNMAVPNAVSPQMGFSATVSCCWIFLGVDASKVVPSHQTVPANIPVPTTMKLPVLVARPRPMRRRGQVGTLTLVSALAIEEFRNHQRRNPMPTISKTSPINSERSGSSSMPG